MLYNGLGPWGTPLDLTELIEREVCGHGHKTMKRALITAVLLNTCLASAGAHARVITVRLPALEVSGHAKVEVGLYGSGLCLSSESAKGTTITLVSRGSPATVAPGVTELSLELRQLYSGSRLVLRHNRDWPLNGIALGDAMEQTR